MRSREISIKQIFCLPLQILGTTRTRKQRRYSFLIYRWLFLCTFKLSNAKDGKKWQEYAICLTVWPSILHSILQTRFLKRAIDIACPCPLLSVLVMSMLCMNINVEKCGDIHSSKLIVGKSFRRCYVMVAATKSQGFPKQGLYQVRLTLSASGDS